MGLLATFTQCIPDTNPNSNTLGNSDNDHSLQFDLKILQQLGLEFCKIIPILAIIDRFSITSNLLGSSFSFLKKRGKFNEKLYVVGGVGVPV